MADVEGPSPTDQNYRKPKTGRKAGAGDKPKVAKRKKTLEKATAAAVAVQPLVAEAAVDAYATRAPWAVRLRGLPFSATPDLIREFLARKVDAKDAIISLAKKNAKISRLKPGELRPGEAQVHLEATRAEAMQCAQLHRQELNGRWIEVEVGEAGGPHALAAEAPHSSQPTSVQRPASAGPDSEVAARGSVGGTWPLGPVMTAAAVAPLPDVASRGGHEIFIKYLPPWTTEEVLRELFAECGEFVGDPVVMRDASTGKCKGVAWITFQSEDGFRAALAWDGSEYGGKRLSITKAMVRAGATKGTAQAPGTHTPAMLTECTDSIVTDPHGCYVDATFGRGGHSRGLLAKLSPEGRLHAFDLDPEAIAAGKRLEREDARFRVHHAPFGTLSDVLQEAGAERVDGILMDLGISSPQLDQAQRGFKPEQDGPLDLRFDMTKGQPASEFLRTVPRDDLARILHANGEEDKVAAGRIADAVVLSREAGRLPVRTRELADLVRRVKGREYQPMHPAKPTFQALRIHLNQEFDELRRGLACAFEVLADGGRVGILTWKHLECAIVVNFFRRHERARDDFPLLEHLRATVPGAMCKLPVEWCLEMDEPRRPSAQELRTNSRSRSAVLHLLRKQRGIRVTALEKLWHRVSS